jgi:DNA repair protein RadA/Sms
VVLHFEGDRGSSLRLVRAVKNRYGPADEVGCFTLGDDGIHGVTDPSGAVPVAAHRQRARHLRHRDDRGPSPAAREVQAPRRRRPLTDPAARGVGLDSSRVAMVLAVVDRRAGRQAGHARRLHRDRGRVRLTEPACDLAVALAVGSADPRRPACRLSSWPLASSGCPGSCGPVTGIQRRLNEAARLGFTRALVPAGSGARVQGMQVREVADLSAALKSAAAWPAWAASTARRPLRGV